MENHSVIRVYGNGMMQGNIVRPNDLKGHVEHSLTMRFGCLLFVDGVYVGGGLKKDFLDKQIKKWEEKISKMNINKSNPTPYPYH